MNKTLYISNWKQIKLGDVAEEVKDYYKPSDKKKFPYIGLEHMKKYDLILSGIGSPSDIKSIKKKFPPVKFDISTQNFA